MSEQSFTVYEPERVKKHPAERADELVFIKDGFAGWAMIASIFWMIYHRSWVPLIGFIVVLGLLAGLAHLFGASPDAGGILFIALSIAFGFLANDIRRMILEKDDFRMIGTITGPTQIECERRFFSNWPPLLNSLHDEDAK